MTIQRWHAIWEAGKGHLLTTAQVISTPEDVKRYPNSLLKMDRRRRDNPRQMGYQAELRLTGVSKISCQPAFQLARHAPGRKE